MPVYETPASVSLEIRLQGGRVLVTTSDEPRTQVDLVPLGRRGQEAIENIVVRADERAGGHVITIEEESGARFRWGPIRVSWSSGDYEVRITCPTGADLELEGGSTELRARGRLGAVSFRSASGDLELGTVSGRLQVKTASGDVAVESTEADASIVTVSGDLEIGRVERPLTARSVSGDVEVGVIRGPVTVTTTSGDVALEAVEVGEVRAQTVSGDARVAVARGTRVYIDAQSVSGDLESELGLEDEAPSGDEGGDVVPLHVKTVSGDVAIVRARERVSA
jgi:DUF4097 and DUF4098 domain-containing protein YvlB